MQWIIFTRVTKDSSVLFWAAKRSLKFNRIKDHLEICKTQSGFPLRVIFKVHKIEMIDLIMQLYCGNPKN